MSFFKGIWKKNNKIELIVKIVFLILILLFFDKKNLLSKTFYSGYIGYIITIIVTMITYVVFKYKLWKSFIINVINQLDELILINEISIFAYCIINSNDFCIAYPKYCIAIIIEILLISATIWRIIYIGNSSKRLDDQKDITLEDLYNGKINSENNVIILKDDIVTYDLLDRSLIENRVKNIIKNYNETNSFVMSIKGKWGEGKTSLIEKITKDLKEEKKYVFIKDFEPWNFRTEDAMIKGMFNAILQNTDLQSGYLYIYNMVQEYIKGVLSQNSYGNLFNFFIKEFNVNDTKDMLNDYLRNSEKKYIFIIDNIDRVDRESIVFLFKCIHNIINLDNVIFILLYDEEIIDKILNEDSYGGYQYLKKIVQLEVSVPPIDNDTIQEIMNKCICNLFRNYNISYHENEIKFVIRLLSKKIKNIRDLKLYLNSVITYNFKYFNNLNIYDILVLEMIKLNNYNLYLKIKDNKRYLVSNFSESDEDCVFKYKYEVFKSNRLSFIKSIIEENKDYLNELIYLFPNIIDDSIGKDLYIFKKQSDEDNKREKRVCDSYFFDTYFTLSKNKYINIVDEIHNLIENFNKNDISKEELKLKIITIVENNEKNIRLFNLFVNSINKDKIKTIVYVLFDLIYENRKKYYVFNEYIHFMILLINKINEDVFKEIFEHLDDKKENWIILMFIKSSAIYNLEKQKYLKEKRKEAILKIINNINILELENYISHIIYYLKDDLDDNEKEMVDNYLASCINEKTVYVFLLYSLNFVTGSENRELRYKYYYNKNFIEEYITLEKLESFLDSDEKELKENEVLLKNIYLKSKEKNFIEEDIPYTIEKLDLNF